VNFSICDMSLNLLALFINWKHNCKGYIPVLDCFALKKLLQ